MSKVENRMLSWFGVRGKKTLHYGMSRPLKGSPVSLAADLRFKSLEKQAFPLSNKPAALPGTQTYIQRTQSLPSISISTNGKG